MNEPGEIHVPWRAMVGLSILALMVLGWISSPRNQQGRPILLLPDVKAVGEYIRLAGNTAKELRLVDGELNNILAGDPTDLFGQTRSAQNSFEHSLRIAQEIDQNGAPPALAGLRDQLSQVSLAYIDAARLTLHWLSVPDAANSQQARQKLTEARTSLKELENSQWLQMKSPSLP
jgi:hypothetical protein